MNSYCTLFPDSLHIGGLIGYEIGNICQGHDMLYEQGICSRKQADDWMYLQLLDKYPKYSILWRVVYQAVRSFGWIFWTMHRMQDAIGWQLGVIGRQGRRMVRRKIQIAVDRYGLALA